jgi:nanoRNase/pAp phosphatase (c-di-AMP/oligoRNAs hydrolase)
LVFTPSEVLMALPEIQQALTVINRSSGILLLVPLKPSADAFSSMLATYLALLEHHQGTVDAVSPSHVSDHLQFLPGSSQVMMSPKVQPEVVVDVAGPQTITDVRQEALAGGVRVHITFNEGIEILKENIETHVRQLPYDVVMVFGAADLEELGDLFTNYADFYYNTPVINIDHRPINEHFGTINIVDITASSIAEVTHELLTNMPSIAIEPNIATALYAAIVAATDSFQSPATKPRAFQLAAELMDKQADKDIVIQHLVKTKPLHLLKLAGRTYARLRYDEYGKLFWSILRPIDFQESGAKPEHITDVMHELTNNISQYNVAFILYEEDTTQRYTVYIQLGKGLHKRRQEIQEQLGARRENAALILTITAASLAEAEKIALKQVRTILP